MTTASANNALRFSIVIPDYVAATLHGARLDGEMTGLHMACFRVNRAIIYYDEMDDEGVIPSTHLSPILGGQTFLLKEWPTKIVLRSAFGAFEIELPFEAARIVADNENPPKSVRTIAVYSNNVRRQNA